MSGPKAEQPAESESRSDAKSTAIFVAGIAVILIGMAVYWTVDWPAGKRSVGDFIMFFFQELIALGLVLVALCAWAVKKVLGSGKKSRPS